ncbi:hypothetical protein F4678DRAFT_299914 [Xylaria arbuscula]|nr:hypothetical protein F4678DRAFT_299914 [Xylaria arbuscula]
MDRAQSGESIFASDRERRPSVRAEDEGSSITTSTITPFHDGTQADYMPEMKSDAISTSNSPSAKLDHSVWIVFATLGYLALALYAWVITCILTYRPIGPHHYGVDIVNSDNDGWGWSGANYIHSLYEKSETYYRSARVIQSIVAVLTIPLTSAVCGRAAVAFLQRNTGITMRQMITLADKGWVEPGVFMILPFRWKRYGSWFLLYALFLSLLGSIISPLQELFLSTKTIKTPTFPQMISYLSDFTDHFGEFVSDVDDGLVTTVTRGRLATAGTTTPQPRLWSGRTDCNTLTNVDNNLLCVINGGYNTFGNFSILDDPFFSELPSGFSTGLVRQFAPRINSTAHREVITADQFPNCAESPGSLHIHYENTTLVDPPDTDYKYFWSVDVCMPGNQTASPWKSSHKRQDFTEKLYLNITLSQFDFSGIESGQYYSEITLDTTAGFFELPNVMNGGLPGPLLEGDPNDLCGTDCEGQGYGAAEIYDHNITRRVTPEEYGSTTAINATVDLQSNTNKGPLLTIALALFGVGSFIDTRQTSQSYISTIQDTDIGYTCLDLVPFIPLLRDFLDQYAVYDSLDPCLHYAGSWDPASQVADYLWALVYNQWDGFGGERIQNAFSTAAFLANEAWMTSNPSNANFWVSYDLGADIQIPVISLAGKILISTLLGIYLFGVLCMALYAARVSRWANTLDAFAMMRVGAAMGDRVPLLVCPDVNRVSALDEMPGNFGDATGGEGKVGELAIGAKTPLKRKRIYRSY